MVPNEPPAVRRARAGFWFCLALPAVVLGLPGRVRAALPSEFEKAPEPVILVGRDLAALWAADVAAFGHPVGAVALLNAGQGMGLWRDWSAPENHPEEKVLALESPLLRSIQDLKPYPNPKPNPDEAALREIALVTASQTSQKDFHDAARADPNATLAQILHAPARYRGKVVHVEGLLRKLRRQAPTGSLKDQNVNNIYEGWIYTGPLDTCPVLVLFTDLPAKLRPGDDLKARVGLDGFFLKVVIHRTPDVLQVMPVVVGRSPYPLPGPAPEPDRGHAPDIAPLVSGAEDQTPLPTPKGNPQEFWGYYETLYVASQTSPQAFQASGKDNNFVTWGHVHADPDSYRGKVIPVQGRLARLVPADVPPELKKLGVEHVYEGWVFSTTEFSNPWVVLVTELPADIKPGMKLDAEVSFQGYFFKKLRYPAVGKDVFSPLLIGRTLKLGWDTRAAAPPPAVKKGPDEYKDEAPLLRPVLGERWADIEDKTRLGSFSPTGNAGEQVAYSDAVVLAAKTAPRAFAASAKANQGITYAQLQKNPASYRGKVIHVEGRLIRLRRFPASEYLRVRGVRWLYEGFILNHQSKDNPWDIVFLDLPRGIKEGETTDYRVAFDGWFFKKLRYTAPKGDRYCPLLIGRTVELQRTGPALPDREAFDKFFVYGLTGLILGMIALAIGLGWWFRRGDRRVRSRVEGARPDPLFGTESNASSAETTPGEEGFRPNGH